MIHKWFYFVYLMLKRNTMLLLNMKLQKKNFFFYDIPKYSKDWYRPNEPHTMNDP